MKYCAADANGVEAKIAAFAFVGKGCSCSRTLLAEVLGQPSRDTKRDVPGLEKKKRRRREALEKRTGSSRSQTRESESEREFLGKRTEERSPQRARAPDAAR